jgi:proteic killer suppression protein
MIKSFKCKDTKLLFEQQRVLRFRIIEQSARNKLRLLNRAISLKDLATVPGLKLEKLHGDRSKQWSIRINNQWRICFEWKDDGVHGVEMVDYH